MKLYRSRIVQTPSSITCRISWISVSRLDTATRQHPAGAREGTAVHGSRQLQRARGDRDAASIGIDTLPNMYFTASHARSRWRPPPSSQLSRFCLQAAAQPRVRSTPLTSSRPVDDWGKLLGDTAAVAAALNRLLHSTSMSSNADLGPGAPRSRPTCAPRRRKVELHWSRPPPLVAAGLETIWKVDRPRGHLSGSRRRADERIGELAAEGKSEARIYMILNEDHRQVEQVRLGCEGTVHGISVRWQQTADARLQPRPPPFGASAWLAPHTSHLILRPSELPLPRKMMRALSDAQPQTEPQTLEKSAVRDTMRSGD